MIHELDITVILSSGKQVEYKYVTSFSLFQGDLTIVYYQDGAYHTRTYKIHEFRTISIFNMRTA